MKKSIKIMALIFTVATLFSCSDSEFSSTSNRVQKDSGSGGGDDLDALGNSNVGLDGNLIHVPSDLDGSGDPDGVAKLDPVVIGKAGKGLDISMDPTKKSASGGSVVSVPVDFYFAVDVTGSMGPNIAGIKNNIEKFASELKEKKYNARLSLVPFRDKVESVMNPTNDINAFKNEVSSQNAAGGGDANEAALAAVHSAIEKIQETKSPDAFAAIIAITDNPAHMGGSTTDCNINPLRDKLNSLPESLQQKIKIYGSFANGGRNCSGFASAKDQFNQLLNQVLGTVPQEQRGSANLSYPFEKGAILDELVPLIEKTIPSKELICVASSAELSYEGSSVGSWKTSSLADSYKRFVSGAKVYWGDAIKDGDLESYSGKLLDLEITRCCVSQEDAAASKFEGCIDNNQKVKFEVK
jgi:hypothetical protein